MLNDEIVGVRETGTEAQHSLRENSAEAASEQRIDERRVSLRRLCGRVFGSNAEQADRVESTVSILLAARATRTAIALCGEGDLVPLAYMIHRGLNEATYPFVVCDPRRADTDGSPKSPPNRRTAKLAVEAVGVGSMCVRAHRLPADAELLISAARMAESSFQLFVCLRGEDRIVDLLCQCIKVPKFRPTSEELDRLIQECLNDATVALGVAPLCMSLHARNHIARCVASLPDLEKTITRLVALKTAPTITQAAVLLGISTTSLVRWASYRNMGQILGQVEQYGQPAGFAPQ